MTWLVRALLAVVEALLHELRVLSATPSHSRLEQRDSPSRTRTRWRSTYRPVASEVFRK